MAVLAEPLAILVAKEHVGTTAQDVMRKPGDLVWVSGSSRGQTFSRNSAAI